MYNQAKQPSFSQAEYRAKKKLTRYDIFLAKMKNTVPGSRLIAVIEPYYPKIGSRGGVHSLVINYALHVLHPAIIWFS